MPKIQKKSNGQYVVTIDKGLGDAMDLEAEDADWKVKSSNTLELTINRNGGDSSDDS